MNIVAPVFQRAVEHGASPALSDGTVSLDYAGLSRGIIRLADYLKSLGVGPGERLMIVGENSVALATYILAGAHVGAVVVLENARRAPLEIEAIFSHAKPKRVIFTFSGSPNAEVHAARLSADSIEDEVIGTFAVSKEYPAGILKDTPDHDGVAAFIYTTGTTGAPKGVMLTHDNLCFIAGMMATFREIRPEDRIYGILPITHVMGIASVLLGGLHAGAHLHLRARFSAATCLSELQSLSITVLQGATAMFAKLVEQARLTSANYKISLRFIGAGGAPIDPTVKKNTEGFFGITLQNGYGLTEAASICWTRFEDANDDDSIGRPLPGVELKILDDDGLEAKTGEVGELWVRGPNVMRGYFRDPTQTAKVLTPEGWFNTQDLGKVMSDGRAFVVGRKKDVIIRSGFKVNPIEVESVLNGHPAIAHSAVVGRQAGSNEEVVAFVELAQSVTSLPADLDVYLRNSLSPYKHPSEILVLAALPLAPNGKVLKAQLLQRAKGASK